MAYENPFTPPTLSGYNSSPPSDDGQRTASNAVRWATHLAKIGNPLRTFALALSASIASAFDAIPTALNERTDEEIAAGVTPTDYSIPSHNQLGFVHAGRYGVVDDNAVSNRTSALNAAYAVAAEASMMLFIPKGRHRFTSKLVWDDNLVDVRGSGRDSTFLEADHSGGVFGGVNIDGANPGMVVEGLTIRVLGSSGGVPPAHNAAGIGIEVTGETRYLQFRRVRVSYFPGRGLYLNGTAGTGDFSKYDISVEYTGGAGIENKNHYRAWFEASVYGARGVGFESLADADYCEGNLTVQGGLDLGVRVAGQQNKFLVYAEGNTGADITLTAASIQNKIFNIHSDTAPGDTVDDGVRNMWETISVDAVSAVHSELFSRPQRGSNAAGLDARLKGGKAGLGATGFAGGSAYLEGGDAAGDTPARGGQARVLGGQGVLGGGRGCVRIQEEGGYIEVGAVTTNDVPSVGLDLSATDRVMRLNGLTTAQIAALTPSGRMFVYDTDLNKLKFYNGAAWETVTSA